MTRPRPIASRPPAGLAFSSDREPGIRRVRSGRGFGYRDAHGRPVRDPAELDRIRALAIPPAWADVWICADPSGHLQAVGRDARGRKQYRYHPTWRVGRDRAKYLRAALFGRALPAIRRQVEADLARPGVPREKVLASVVRILESTSLRVGNDEYARSNRSYGLTTLRDRHVTVDGSELRFRFRTKGGRIRDVELRDRRLARIVARCRDLAGQDLFQYLDEDGEARPIGSGDVNDYLRRAAGARITAKDFRTWAGTLLAFRALRGTVESGPAAARRTIASSTELVAEALGNTPAVSRQSYIAPVVIDAFESGALSRGARAPAAGALDRPATRREELELVRLLESASRARAANEKPAVGRRER